MRGFFGSLLFIVIAQSASAHEGWGIVSDARGRVFFTDVARSIVWRLDPDGTLVAVLTNTHSHALVSIGDGSVYGSHAERDAATGSVWRIAPDGRVHTLLPPTRDLPLGLESFLIDTDGTVYSAIGWAPEGRVWLLRRKPGGLAERVAEGFASIDGMAWAPDGAILLTDGPYLKRVTLVARNAVRAHEGPQRDGRTDPGAYDGPHSAARTEVGAYERRRSELGVVETLGGGALTETRWDADLSGVTTDGSGGAFVADFAGGRVLAIGRQAGVALEYASNFPWSPTGIARDANGLVVLEHLKMPWSLLADLQIGPYLRVRRLGLKGRVVTLEVLWGTRSTIAAAGLALVTATLIGWRLRSYHRSAAHK